MKFLNQNGLAVLNKICMSVSGITLFFTVLCGILRRTGPIEIPAVISVWILPVMTASAVGYLTNYAAIWLLFKPYHKIPWLNNLQGVIPSRQASLAESLGKEIPENLLPPDELVARLNEMVSDYLDNPDLITGIRSKVNFYVAKRKTEISAFVMPYIESALSAALEKSVTPQNVKVLCDSHIDPWIRKQISGEQVSRWVMNALKTRVPSITSAIRNFITSAAQEYVQSEYPTLTTWIHADEFAARMVSRMNWGTIREKIAGLIADPNTIPVIRAELAGLAVKLSDYIHSPQFDTDADTYCADIKAKITAGLHAWLEKNLPDAVDTFIQKDEIWESLKTEVIPTIKAFITHRLKRDREQIIAAMNLSGRIEESIMKQTPETIHELVNRVSGEHLVLIQLLGYVLGGIAGFMLVFAQ